MTGNGASMCELGPCEQYVLDIEVVTQGRAPELRATGPSQSRHSKHQLGRPVNLPSGRARRAKKIQ